VSRGRKAVVCIRAGRMSPTRAIWCNEQTVVTGHAGLVPARLPWSHFL